MDTSKKSPYLPDYCACQTLPDGEKMGWVYASFWTDGTPICRDEEDWRPEYGEAYPCVCREAKHAGRYRELLQRQCNVPEGRWHFSDYRCEGNAAAEMLIALSTVQGWAGGQLELPWVFMLGRPGTGKTHLSCAAVQALVGGSVHARYEYLPDLIDDLRAHQTDGWYQERISQLRAVEALVLDDLGASPLTDWAQGEIVKLVDYRYREHAPLIVTTNAAPEQLEERLIDRLEDHRMSRVVPMLWESYRRTGRST